MSPLKSGSSKGVISQNIKKLTTEYKIKGKIGASKPTNIGKAVAQANAIAFSKAKKGGK